MGRWQPDARGRLQQAAMELFSENGYTGTTVGQIAERAGLTERTFFRYFTDKREALFYGSGELQAFFARAVADAPAGASAFEAMAAGLMAVGEAIPVPRERARMRNAVVSAHPELQERELNKLAGLSQAVTGALRERGVPEPAASLVAEAGLAVFKVGFTRWLEDDTHDLPHHLREGLEVLRSQAR